MTASAAPSGFAVVTAVLCTAHEFPSELGDDYQAACVTLGLAAHPGGYALLLGHDADGARWTLVTTGVDDVATVLAVWRAGNEASLRIDADSLVATRRGWPVECGDNVVGRPPPHDPAGAGPLLTPPSTRTWANADRRRAADHLASDLSDTRDPVDIEFDQLNWGDTELRPPPARLVDLIPRATAPDHPAVVQALRSVWLLAAAEHPPPGSVRAKRAAGGGRLVRAGGNGWSLVANTADPVQALLLLDDMPDIAVDVSGTEGLPRLLDALTAAAARAVPRRPQKPRKAKRPRT